MKYIARAILAISAAAFIAALIFVCGDGNMLAVPVGTIAGALVSWAVVVILEEPTPYRRERRRNV